MPSRIFHKFLYYPEFSPYLPFIIHYSSFTILTQHSNYKTSLFLSHSK